VELSDKIGEVIIKNTRYQYERNLAARRISGRSAIQITSHSDNAGGNDVALLSGMKNGVRNRTVLRALEITEVKNRFRKSRISAATNCAASLLEI
jgi:hypothetical protein